MVRTGRQETMHPQVKDISLMELAKRDVKNSLQSLESMESVELEVCKFYLFYQTKKMDDFILGLLGSLVTNQNYIHEEIKCRLKAGNSCYYSVQTLLPSRLLSKNLKIKIYKTIILPVVLYGCETWSLTLREERRLRVF